MSARRGLPCIFPRITTQILSFHEDCGEICHWYNNIYCRVGSLISSDLIERKLLLVCRYGHEEGEKVSHAASSTTATAVEFHFRLQWYRARYASSCSDASCMIARSGILRLPELVIHSEVCVRIQADAGIWSVIKSGQEQLWILNAFIAVKPLTRSVIGSGKSKIYLTSVEYWRPMLGKTSRCTCGCWPDNTMCCLHIPLTSWIHFRQVEAM